MVLGAGAGVVLAGDLLPGAAGGGRPAGWWAAGVDSGEKEKPLQAVSLQGLLC